MAIASRAVPDPEDPASVTAQPRNFPTALTARTTSHAANGAVGIEMTEDEAEFAEALDRVLDAYFAGEIDLMKAVELRSFHLLQSFNKTLDTYLESKKMMKRYRKKQIEFDAMQWFPNVKHRGVKEDTDRKMVEFMAQPPVESSALWGLPGYYVITIHEQRAYLVPGDYICPEPKEMRFYPCKPDIFEANNELVDG